MLPVKSRVQWIIDDSLPNMISCNVAVVAALVKCFAMYGRFLFASSESPKPRSMGGRDGGVGEERQSSSSDEQEFISIVIMHKEAKSRPSDQEDGGRDDAGITYTHLTGLDADVALGELKISVEVSRQLITLPCKAKRADGTAHVPSASSQASLYHVSYFS